MEPELENIYERLFGYCESEGFSGYDPFDGLNSSLFQATPLRRIPLARLVWLQAVKRSAIDLRSLLRVPKGVNAKGIALFALAELARFRHTGDERHAKTARCLLEQLSGVSIVGKTPGGNKTTAFGYNFDWQSRVFFAPEGTPAIVPTAFASQAYVEAYKEFGDDTYLRLAGEICRFVMNGLNRSDETDDEVCFGYTPVDHSVIYNASLLAGECLARVGAITGNEEYLGMAAKAARYVVRRQRDDGAWIYGANSSQGWADNFHTAYVLLSLKRIADFLPEFGNETQHAIRKGTEYWLNNFFLEDGTPKYYDNEVYPVDIHSAAVAIATLAELRGLDSRMLPLAQRVAKWTVANMLGPEGHFYYQLRKNSVIKTSFIRWGQAWMAYALARLSEIRAR